MQGNFYFLILGGLGFFFYGMKIMSEGLKKVAGERLKSFLHMATKVPIIGLFTGFLVTVFLHSSSATTVMVVGFVNAGLLSLKQAISVIFGANIGTTLMAWIVSSMSVIKLTEYALPAVGIGFAIMAFGRSRKTRFWGEVLIGTGMLFVGLGLLKDACEPLKDTQQLKDLFVMFAKNPILGVLAGMVFTTLLQSSSVTIAIVQVLAFKGIISFSAAIPIVLGDNIGTTITAQLAALGTNINARRAAMAHTMFNVIGVSYMIVFVYLGWYERFISFIIPGELTLKSVMFHIAVAHSAFNIVNALVFLPFIGFIEKVSIWLVPQRKGRDEFGVKYLEEHLLDTPPVAMQQVRNETLYMLSVAEKAVNTAVQGFLDKSEALVQKALEYEKATDNLQSEITQYVIDLSQREISVENSQEIPVLLHNVNDIERMGDHAKNITEIAQLRIDSAILFSELAIEELKVMWQELKEMFTETKTAFEKLDRSMAEKLLEREDRMNAMQIRLKEAHIERLNQGVCKIKANYVFLDFIDNLEKIADHLTNISQSIIGQMQWRRYKVETKQKAANPDF
ncbi:MAG TPA: Na/Pi cotransporter family protein [Candidatus Omnitrophota bacterium]|nr:Na/Pi cotransporter family protein [Candidatus Omnitrophota bacterium]HSA31564.1 Na/Pi cotransporter family protein [Candidatus Omnitrophota bacterium]